MVNDKGGKSGVLGTNHYTSNVLDEIPLVGYFLHMKRSAVTPNQPSVAANCV
jgi:hypothetical protein